MQKFITWNVAGIRPRLPLLLTLLAEEAPDFCLLQETKALESVFPFDALEKAGYHAVVSAQKAWNGTAVLCRKTPVSSLTQLPNSAHIWEAPQARFVEVRPRPDLAVISVYVPNGNPPEKDPADRTRLTAKLQWMQALEAHLKNLRDQHVSVVLGGDFNVIEKDEDVYNPALYCDNALMVPPVRDAFQNLQRLLPVHVLRETAQEKPLYSFWDFQGFAFPRNFGMLLDTFLLSSDLKKNLIEAGVLKKMRAAPRPSDHAPVFCVLNNEAS